MCFHLFLDADFQFIYQASGGHDGVNTKFNVKQYMFDYVDQSRLSQSLEVM